MSEKEYSKIDANMFVGVIAFEVDLHRYELKDGFYYNPTIGMYLDLGSGKESRIYLSTEIYEDNAKKAIFYAFRIATGFTTNFYPDVIVVDENDDIIEDETYDIKEIIEAIQMMASYEEIPDGVTIH